MVPILYAICGKQKKTCEIIEEALCMQQEEGLQHAASWAGDLYYSLARLCQNYCNVFTTQVETAHRSFEGWSLMLLENDEQAALYFDGQLVARFEVVLPNWVEVSI